MSDSTLLVAGRKIVSGHESYYSALMLIFSEADRHELSTDAEDGWGLYYETTVAIARDRLDVLGYSLERARESFESGLIQLKRELAALEHRYAGDEEIALLVEVDGYFAREATFDGWQQKVREYLLSHPPSSELAPYGPVSFDHAGEEDRAFDILGFPGKDPLACLRGILEVSPDTALIRYDLSGLVRKGFVEPDEEVAIEARVGIGAAYLPSERIIVLTEGSIDSTVLRRSLALLAPHLESYFSFLDFEAMRVQGGAGTVIGFLKAFVGAGVANRIIAILDNDAAGRDAARTVAALPLPPRVRLLHYPPLPLLENYPTVGPTGVAQMDVNGLAGSIEMYMGEDVLRKNDGQWVPVQWGGYVEGVKAYQGELMGKLEVKRRFEAKLDQCEVNKNLVGTYDWSGVRAILHALQTAFVTGPH